MKGGAAELCLTSWKKTAFRVDLFPYGIASWDCCVVFSQNILIPFSATLKCFSRWMELVVFPIKPNSWRTMQSAMTSSKNTSKSKIVMSSFNLWDSPVPEVLLGAFLRAVWWYQLWLRPVIAEGATSQWQALLCSVSCNSELWGIVTFCTMQWTSFSLVCETTGELFGSFCSPRTQSNPRCTVILWVTLRICMY